MRASAPVILPFPMPDPVPDNRPLFFPENSRSSATISKKSTGHPLLQKNWSPPAPHVPLCKKIDRTDRFQNRSGRPLFFHCHTPCFPWSSGEAGWSVRSFLKMAGPIDSGIGRGDRLCSGIKGNPPPPTSRSAKKWAGAIVSGIDRTDRFRNGSGRLVTHAGISLFRNAVWWEHSAQSTAGNTRNSRISR